MHCNGVETFQRGDLVPVRWAQGPAERAALVVVVGGLVLLLLLVLRLMWS
jgi:hypothetical protein